MQIAATLGPKYQASATTLKSDARQVLSRWAREDGRHNARRKAVMLRRLDCIAAQATIQGSWRDAVAAITAQGRLLGLIPPANVTAIANASRASDERRIVLPVSLILPTADHRDESYRASRQGLGGGA